MRPLRIVVSGMAAADPHQGGATWAVLQYVLGLRQLGHNVLLVEPLDRLTRNSISSFASTVDLFGLGGNAALIQRGTAETWGLAADEISARCRRADVLLNVSGMLRDPTLVETIPIRVYLDLDPAFNQLWAEVEGIDVGLDGHTHFVTVGLRLGTSGCTVPTCGRTWIRTLPPVVLSQWPFVPRASVAAFTTVGNWRSYGSIEVGGRHYGQKAHSMRALLGIPTRADHAFMVALAIHPGERDDLAALDAHGWRLVDPTVLAGNASDYRRFVQTSFAEIGIAKSGYVESRCGWFSDRSACYLASGRPVVAQDTGFDEWLPLGQGLLTFRDEDEAVEAVEAVSSRYTEHRLAARRIADEHLDSDLVLARLLEEVGAT